jgi:hypothetical protein
LSLLFPLPFPFLLFLWWALVANASAPRVFFPCKFDRSKNIEFIRPGRRRKKYTRCERARGISILKLPTFAPRARKKRAPAEAASAAVFPFESPLGGLAATIRMPKRRSACSLAVGSPPPHPLLSLAYR